MLSWLEQRVYLSLPCSGVLAVNPGTLYTLDFALMINMLFVQTLWSKDAVVGRALPDVAFSSVLVQAAGYSRS